ETLPGGQSELTGLFIEKPESTTVTKGKNVTFVAKVDSSDLLRKPNIKWLKGKWLDLASKAGKHVQFKEAYDRNTKVLVEADAGGYRCEVTSKDKCDSCTFEVTVEGSLILSLSLILFLVPRGDAGEDAGDLDFSALLKKRLDMKDVDVWEILKNAKPCDYEKIAFDYGITDLRGLLKRLKKMKKVEPKKSDAFLKKLEECYSVDKGKRVQMHVELHDPDVHVKWLKNGVEIKPSANVSGCVWGHAYMREGFRHSLLFVLCKYLILSHSVLLCLSICLPTRHVRYVFESVGNKRTLTINKCNLSDDAAYECVVGEEKCFTEVFVKEPPVTITKLLDDVHVVVGDRVEFECEVSEEGANVKWMKDGVELTKDGRYRMKKDGKKHTLIINEAEIEDIGMYYVCTNGGESKGELEVEAKELEVLQSIADLSVKASEQAVFKCEVSDEKVVGKWFKDGVEVQASKRIKMSHIGRIHKLTIDDVKPQDEGNYTFVPEGYALNLSAKLNFIELLFNVGDQPAFSHIPLPVPPLTDPPKIHLDTSGTGNKNTIIVVAGNKLRLDVEVTGEPAPSVCWKKGDTVHTVSSLLPTPGVPPWVWAWAEGCSRHVLCGLMKCIFCQVISEAEGRVRVETRNLLSSFVIEGAERADEGRYTITVTNPAGEDRVELTVQIVDVPNPPENVKCMGVGEDTATIMWDPPNFDGGSPVRGYLMERKKKGSSRWTKLNFEVFESTTYEAKKMIEGVLYEMRVFAVNGIGMSQPSAISKPFMPIAPTSEPIRLTVEDVTDTTCALKWLPPERVGAGGIDGYIIEWCKEGEDNWVAANEEPVERNLYRVKGLPTGEKVLFRVVAVNMAGRSPPCVMNQSVNIREIMEHPKIRLPRQLRTKFIRKVGEKVNLVIPFQGKPRPVVTWFKDGEPLENKSVGIRTSDFDTILFIRTAERDHSGTYTLSVQIENMQDKADIHIQIVDKPGPPVNVMVTDVWGFNAALEWKPPKDTGNTDITGYTIQKADKKTQEWFTVYEHNRRPSCTVSDLVMGNEYTFRVFAENICGLSDEVAIKLQYNRPPFKEKDMSSSPKFTAPLVDKCVPAGYSTAISCAVRAYPKAKIVWMKNKMIIGEDPKFLMQNNQGVLTLNIRKPSQFDGGKYSCKAINALGEDEVECRLEVRGTGGGGHTVKSTLEHIFFFTNSLC
uniref:Myosin binding protein C, fast type a n=1 Tax=Esox lucius TaxID=8010 RepID=A0A6Q2XC56_ESOLU